MRCVQFRRLPNNSSKQFSASPIHTATSKRASVLPSLLRQPSNNLAPSTIETSPADNCQEERMIRRSQRESAKSQSVTSNTTNMTGSTLQPKFTRAVSTTSSTSSTAVKPGGASLAAKPSTVTTSATATTAATMVTATQLSSGQTEAARSNSAGNGGGRHPHPPNANNTKLKHKCPFDGCPWRFATPYKLRRHIKSHTKETPYLCKECGRGFSVRYNLLMHIQTIHSQPQKFKCPMRGCKEAFHSQSRLNGHLRRIHKKDWKSLQASKDLDLKTTRARNQDSTDDVLTTNGPRKTRLPSASYKCPECVEEFTSKAKLSSHIKIHAQDSKTFKCIVQGCEKYFSNEDKLSKHTESHKNSKQFCCPHKNCNRIFLRQTHLRNHLKIHTQDHQFICPVLDCSQKFASESAYNVHLNSHINYGYSCPYPGCEQSFLSHKRLAIHAQVVHNVFTTETGICSPLLDGIQPHLGMSASLHSPTSPSYMAPPSNHAHHNSKSCVLDKDFIRNVDLPGLSVDDIEAVLSENEDWSGEQIDQFLRSAVDLSEIESKLFSLASYESDSGYSTYDVSPVTSTAPANLNYQVSSLSSCPPPPLTLINHSTSPLFGNPAFPGMSIPPHHTPSPLMHEAAISPCGSDGGFFSPHSGFGSLSNTPNQETMVFFPPPVPPSIYSHPYSHTQEFNASNVFSITDPCFADSAVPNFSLQIPDILLHDVNTPHLPPSLLPSSDIKFSSCGVRPSELCEEEISTQEKNDTTLVKAEGSPNGCAFEDSSNAGPPLLTVQPESKAESPTHCAQNSVEEENHLAATAAQYRYTASLMGSLSKKSRGKLVSKTVQKKKKTQWPRSMNRANLMAFREHILNKLKKAQDATADAPVNASSMQGDADVKGATTSTPIKFEALSPNGPFEIQVMCERNHLAPPKRCHSEPACLQSNGTATTMQTAQSDSNLSVPSTPQYLGADGEMFADFNCNPDLFLSSCVDEKLLNDIELNMEAGSDEGGMFNFFNSAVRPTHCSSTTSTLSEVETMDIDCIQDLLDDSKQVFSPSSSIAGSPSAASPPGGDSHTPTVSASSPVSLASNSSADKACHSPKCGAHKRELEEAKDNAPFTFPEILSIHGSMVLDGVSVLSEGETDPSNYQPEHTFLQSHHDPLLAADSLGTPPAWN